MAKAVADAIEARLGATWTSTDGTVLTVIGRNGQGMPPADLTPHIEIEYPITNESQLTLGDPGNNFYRQEGVFRLIVNEVRGLGASRARGWADELAALFRGQTFSSVACFDVDGPVEDESNDDGAWFKLAIAVRYWFYVTG